MIELSLVPGCIASYLSGSFRDCIFGCWMNWILTTGLTASLSYPVLYPLLSLLAEHFLFNILINFLPGWHGRGERLCGSWQIDGKKFLCVNIFNPDGYSFRLPWNAAVMSGLLFFQHTEVKVFRYFGPLARYRIHTIKSLDFVRHFFMYKYLRFYVYLPM